MSVDDYTAVLILQGLLMLLGVAIMVWFIRTARRVEPFTAPL
jgi:hypothetical protein